MRHYIKEQDYPSDYEIVYDQNGNRVYYVNKLKLWMYEETSNVAEVKWWKEIE